ncbi:unnamed protein product [Amaranthus hypochondriacus]
MLLILPFLAIISLLYLFFLINPKRNGSLNLPPGPKGLPLIGNLHQFEPSKPHIYFSNLAKIYGPILSLKFGCRQVIVIQSSKLAKEVLQTQDLNFCNRPKLVGCQRLSYNGLDIVFTPFGDYFREIKKISVVHLFSSKRVESFASVRQEEIAWMVQKIQSLSSSSQIVNLSHLLSTCTRFIICKIAFGKRYEDQGGSRRFDKLLSEAEAMFSTFFFTDYFPRIGWVDNLIGKFSRLEKIFKDLDEFYDEIINDHINPNRPPSQREDIVDVLLHLKKERSFELSLEHIKAVLMNILLAGTETSSAMVVWAMTELIKNPTSMKKAQDELRNGIKDKDCIQNSDLIELDYFKAVVKETLRLHTATPLLVVHENIQKSIIQGFDILPNTLVYVNAWSIMRDPESWTDPEKFMPERFLKSSIDFKGNNFELIPFGAGRRICPGLLLGLANLELALANLLFFFDWDLPYDLKEEDIDTDILPGITMHKKNPLCLLAKRVDQSRAGSNG